MKNRTMKMTYTALVLVAVFLAAVMPGRADAVVAGPTDVTIKKACISMPDGTVTAPGGTPAITCPAGTIPMWLPYDNVGAAYLAPGSFKITAAEGDSLTITVKNELGIPVSLFIAGQVMTPNNGPVWFADITAPYTGVTATGSRPTPVHPADPSDPAFKYRVRSFTHETAAGAAGLPGAAQTYIWPSLKAGTYLILSGTHPSLQVPMGIYGVLTVTGAAWPAYDQEATLLFSEIDPYIHNAADDVAKSFPSTNDYKPKYFLINGKPFPGNDPIPIGAAASTTLLRFVNAGVDTYVPLLQGQSMQVIAEDGNLKAPELQFIRYSVDLHAGKTFDALLTNPAAAAYIPVYDRRLYMSNAAEAPGGMLAYLEVPDAVQHQLTVATNGGTGTGRVVAESVPGGINCDSSIVPPAPGATNCTQLYNAGTELKLVGRANPGSLLTTWANCDSITPSNECLVTMAGAKSVTATFVVVTAPTLIAPAANAQIPAGSSYIITWAAPAKAATYTLKYSLDNGVTWVLIGKNLTGNSFLWIVPTPRKSTTTALIKLTAFNNAGVNMGSDTNTVSIKTLAIIHPTTGDVWTSGVNNLHDIVWETFAAPGLVKSIVIKYSKNNGASWLPVATLDNTSGAYDDGGTYHWQIEPQVGANKPASRVKIILKDAVGKNIASADSKKFTITP